MWPTRAMTTAHGGNTLAPGLWVAWFSRKIDNSNRSLAIWDKDGAEDSFQGQSVMHQVKAFVAQPPTWEAICKKAVVVGKIMASKDAPLSSPIPGP